MEETRVNAHFGSSLGFSPISFWPSLGKIEKMSPWPRSEPEGVSKVFYGKAPQQPATLPKSDLEC